MFVTRRDYVGDDYIYEQCQSHALGTYREELRSTLESVESDALIALKNEDVVMYPTSVRLV